MEIANEIMLKDLKGWHKGMSVYSLDSNSGKIEKLPVSKPTDVITPEAHCIYQSASNDKTGFSKLHKIADKIIEGYKEESPGVEDTGSFILE